VLCHSDLHPGNVIMTAQGPRPIDWLGATRAPAAYEIAQCHVLIAELDPSPLSSLAGLDRAILGTHALLHSLFRDGLWQASISVRGSAPTDDVSVANGRIL